MMPSRDLGSRGIGYEYYPDPVQSRDNILLLL